MAKNTVKTVSTAVEFRNVPMRDIDEPVVPARVAMDEQTLDDLAESIADMGVILPIVLVTVRKRFEIIDGHRRFLASRIAGRQEIPAMVYTSREWANEAVKLHANLHREDLSAAEEALFFAELQTNHGYNEEQLCAAVKKKPDYIAQRLNLLKGDAAIFKALTERQIKFGVARELNRIDDPHYRAFYLDNAIRCDPTYATVQNWVLDWKKNTAPSGVPLIPEVPEGVEPPAPGEVYDCQVCGGTKDPWNFVFVRMHKWEWDAIHKSLQRPPEEV